MYYSALQLRNYRSYKDYSIQLSPSINIVVGPNASGKTNLLEAILVASHGKSYRSKDIDLINFDSDWARVEAYTDDEKPRVISISRNSDGTTVKEIVIDGNQIKRLTLEKKPPITLFEPDHLRIVQGSPEARRTYLDGILEHTKQGYSTTLRHYKRALAQRNKLLKTGHNLADDFFVWDVKLSEYGARIFEARTELIKQINKQASKLYSKLSGHKSKLKLRYVSKLPTQAYAESFLKALADNLATDVERGYTGLGPHREDLSFVLDSHEAGASASRGETRTIILTLKLVELQIIETSREDKPILLLDDVFSELDSARRRLLTEYLKDYQTIITTTDADAIIKHFIGDYNVIPTQVD